MIRLLEGALATCALGLAAAVPAPVSPSTEIAPGAPAPPAPAPPDRGPIFDDREVAPRFASGPLADARARYEAGLHAEAAKLFAAHDDGSPQVAYLRALALLGDGRAAEAAEALAALAPRYAVLADRLAWHEGMARERAGDARGAAAAYGRIPETSVLFDDARLSEARMRRRFDPAGALAALAPLEDRRPPPLGRGRDVGADALLLAGEIHAARGDRKAAKEAYLRLWSEHSLSRQAEDAKLRADAMGAAPTREQHLSRALVYLNAQRNREAAELLERVLAGTKLPDPVACEAQYALGRAHRKLREHTKAIGKLEPVVARCEDRALRAKALYILGTSAAIAAPTKGVAVYEKLASEYPEHSFADDALLFVADLRMREGARAEARDALQRLVDAYPEGDFRADALFRLFWIDRADGKAEKGLEALRIVERDYGLAPDSLDLERSLYWQARTLAQLGRKVEALATYEKLVREHPAGYYAMLARGRLGELDAAVAAEVEKGLPDPPAELPPLELRTAALVGDAHYQAALELFRLGFVRSAADELWSVDRKAAKAKGGAEPVLVIAYLLDKADARQAAHHIARTELRELLRGRPEQEGAVPFRIAYPLAYRDLIERHANAYAVPPDLMQALMREESSLDPNIVSWAGAIGLTQLMPTTARAVARQLRLPAPSERELRDPDLNVRIGTAYFGKLLKLWKGNPALAAASYNAGEGAVGRWLKERGSSELDEFVEEIPIKETRDYVKRVLKSFNAYRLTYGKGQERFLALAPAPAQPAK